MTGIVVAHGMITTHEVIIVIIFVAVVLLGFIMLQLYTQLTILERKIKEIEKLEEFKSYLHSINEEHRCNYCEDRDNCPAYMSGVLFPCPGYKEANDGEQK